MSITATWCCFLGFVLFWIMTAFLKSCPLSEHSHVLSCCVPFPKGSGGVLFFFFSLQHLLLASTGAGSGFLGDLKMDYILPLPCLAGYSSFKINKQIFLASHRVNIKEGFHCQYILQKQNTMQFNNRKCQIVMTLYWFLENTQSALKFRSHLGQLDLILW